MRAADDPVLHELADAMARHHFGAPFDGVVGWAPRLRFRAGEYRPAERRIRLSLPYRDRYGDGLAREVLLHELCHWWLHRCGIRHRENAAVFQALLRRTGAPRRAPPAPMPPRPLFAYRCPACGRRYLYRRRVSGYACGDCCRRHARGRFHPRFLLIPEAAAPAAPPPACLPPQPAGEGR